MFIEQFIQSNAVIHVLNWMELIKKKKKKLNSERNKISLLKQMKTKQNIYFLIRNELTKGSLLLELCKKPISCLNAVIFLHFGNH